MCDLFVQHTKCIFNPSIRAANQKFENRLKLLILSYEYAERTLDSHPYCAVDLTHNEALDIQHFELF